MHSVYSTALVDWAVMENERYLTLLSAVFLDLGAELGMCSNMHGGIHIILTHNSWMNRVMVKNRKNFALDEAPLGQMIQ